MIVEEFLKNKITQTDLEIYEKQLNQVYREKVAASNHLFEVKRAVVEGKMTKEDLREAKKNEKNAKRNYLLILKNQTFKNEAKESQTLVKSLSSQDPLYNEAVAYAAEVKKFEVNFQKIIKERGRNAKVAKLNNIAIAVENLSFRYNANSPEVLKNISFQIKEGEYVTVIGHNGSGKSTLSKILIGVLNHQQGTIKMFGNMVSLQNIEQIRQFLGIVFQNPDNQFIGSTVRGDIAFGLENRCVPTKEMAKMIIHAAQMVGVEKILDSEPLNLSGGQKQRVAIASAIALNPLILIFDEATSMLDPKGRREIKEIMVGLRNESAKTIISVTHDMDEILSADKVLVLNHGEVVKFGTPQEILSDLDFLKSIHLGVPFIYQVQEILKKANIDISQTQIQDLDSLAEALC